MENEVKYPKHAEEVNLDPKEAKRKELRKARNKRYRDRLKAKKMVAQNEAL